MYDDNRRYTRIRRVCPYCGLIQKSPPDAVDPLTWYTPDEMMLYDPNTDHAYLPGDPDEGLPD